MKAVLALIIIYVGTFLIVIQSASQNSVEAKKQDAGSAAQSSRSIDPAKEADIRSLMELLGVRDLLKDSATKGIEQYRENLLASVPDNERGRQFVNAFLDGYQKKFNPDDAASQFTAIYDKHFSEDDIKGLLEFYGSPLGQKYAAEMPKVNAEIQAANRAASVRVAKEVLQDLRSQYPGISARARLQKRNSPSEQGQQQLQPQTRPTASHP
jgi:hypothetical protein